MDILVLHMMDDLFYNLTKTVNALQEKRPKTQQKTYPIDNQTRKQFSETKICNWLLTNQGVVQDQCQSNVPQLRQKVVLQSRK